VTVVATDRQRDIAVVREVDNLAVGLEERRALLVEAVVDTGERQVRDRRRINSSRPAR